MYTKGLKVALAALVVAFLVQPAAAQEVETIDAYANYACTLEAVQAIQKADQEKSYEMAAAVYEAYIEAGGCVVFIESQPMVVDEIIDSYVTSKDGVTVLYVHRFHLWGDETKKPLYLFDVKQPARFRQTSV